MTHSTIALLASTRGKHGLCLFADSKEQQICVLAYQHMEIWERFIFYKEEVSITKTVQLEFIVLVNSSFCTNNFNMEFLVEGKFVVLWKLVCDI